MLEREFHLAVEDYVLVLGLLEREDFGYVSIANSMGGIYFS